MGENQQRSGGGAIFGHPELPCWRPGTYRRWRDCEFGAGVHKSDSLKDHCSLRISSVGHEQNEMDLRRDGPKGISKIPKDIQRRTVAPIPTETTMGPRNQTTSRSAQYDRL